MVSSKSRTITLAAVLLLGSIVLIVSLSVFGFFDPIAVGEPIWQQELNPMPVGPESTEVRWLKDDLPDSSLSVRLTAGYDSGESDSAYGLLLGQEDENTAVVVSPLGYAAVWQQSSSTDFESVNYYLPWQTWPHVRTGVESNELLVHLDGDKVSVRVNGEWLWEADEIERVDRIGIVGISYGEDVSIDFHSADLSAVEPGQ